MIFDWLLAPVLSILNTIFSALPTAPLGLATPGGDGSYSATYMASQIAAYLHQAAYFIPVPLLLTVVLLVLAFMAALMVYEVAQWCYRELPDLGGFGPS